MKELNTFFIIWFKKPACYFNVKLSDLMDLLHLCLNWWWICLISRYKNGKKSLKLSQRQYTWIRFLLRNVYQMVVNLGHENFFQGPIWQKLINIRYRNVSDTEIEIVQFTGEYIAKACLCLGKRTVYPNDFSRNEVILHNSYKM